MYYHTPEYSTSTATVILVPVVQVQLYHTPNRVFVCIWTTVCRKLTTVMLALVTRMAGFTMKNSGLQRSMFCT